jgi:hypothetical protein
MWESRSDFQGLWKAVFAFHQAVISTGLPGRALSGLVWAKQVLMISAEALLP